jgi:hypothetical protein
MKTPHKHAAIIKAWADGAEVQYYALNEWHDLGEQPCWFRDSQFRIKPKPDRVYYGVFENDGSSSLGSCFTRFHDEGDQIKVTFDGATGKLKSAEVL